MTIILTGRFLEGTPTSPFRPSFLRLCCLTLDCISHMVLWCLRGNVPNQRYCMWCRELIINDLCGIFAASFVGGKTFGKVPYWCHLRGVLKLAFFCHLATKGVLFFPQEISYKLQAYPLANESLSWDSIFKHVSCHPGGDEESHPPGFSRGGSKPQTNGNEAIKVIMKFMDRLSSQELVSWHTTDVVISKHMGLLGYLWNSNIQLKHSQEFSNTYSKSCCKFFQLSSKVAVSS